MKRRTVVVDGPLAFRMRRTAAARDAESGPQMVTLPQLAVLLGGGLVRSALSPDLDGAIRKPFASAGFRNSMASAILPARPAPAPACLPASGTRTFDWTTGPRHQRAARRRSRRASVQTYRWQFCRRATFATRAWNGWRTLPWSAGSVEFIRVAPAWRPLLDGLARAVWLMWSDPGAAEASLFPGEVHRSLPLARLPPSKCRYRFRSSLIAKRSSSLPLYRWLSSPLPNREARQSIPSLQQHRRKARRCRDPDERLHPGTRASDHATSQLYPANHREHRLQANRIYFLPSSL